MLKKITVMVADDSALMRRMISDMINMEEDMEVIDTARNGEELLIKLKDHTPEVITLDVEMPKLNGIETLKRIVEEKIPVKVIMLSSLTKDGARITLECLDNGAVDFISKPSGSISLNINDVKESLVSKIRGVSTIRTKEKSTVNINNRLKVTRSSAKKISKGNNIGAVAIGASTGGPKALFNVITNLPENLGVPVFVVQHMPVGFTKAFAERLDKFSKLKVVEAEDGCKIENNVVYIAPGGKHMEVNKNNTIRLTMDPIIHGVRPAVDKLFISASSIYTNRLMAIVLTGMGKDGAKGIIEVKKNGGYTISEDESTCVIYGMPKAAYETKMVDEVIPLHGISEKISYMIVGDVRV